MAAVLNFYIDDSGTRNPDRNTTENSSEKDWFALGGVIIRENDEGTARTAYDRFCHQWGITYPLHSYEIRHRDGRFRWLAALSNKERLQFLGSLERFLLGLPVIGLACVIDRPGYNHRYKEKYGRQRWALCKTAFCVVAERAAKHAVRQKAKLRILAERCSKKDDAKLKDYYLDLKNRAAPFDKEKSNKYSPLDSGEFRRTLYEIRIKSKTSPLIQIADLYLWPMCMGGYDKINHPYRAIIREKKLVDCLCNPEEVEELGVKYSCFDLVTPRTKT